MFLPSWNKGFRLRGGGDARIGQPALDFAIAVEIAQRFRRRDGGDDQRPVFGGTPVFGNADFVAGRGQGVEIRNDFVPVEQLAVGADGMSEVGFRRGDGGEAQVRGEQKAAKRLLPGGCRACLEL